jgi:hypothetical protein
MKLAQTAIDHQDNENALTLVAEATTIFETIQWAPEFRIPISVELSVLRYQGGQQERARREIDLALQRYQTEHQKIMPTSRAAVLRNIAEAYASMDDPIAAAAAYRQAAMEGAENPNARPRAIDLAATCCSMARFAIEPDEQLWTTLRMSDEGLTHPW